MRKPVLLLSFLAVANGAAFAADLSPAKWPLKARERAERTEAQRWAPRETRLVKSSNGLISAVASPVAVLAGLEALRQGGNAADAAATVALTQITRQLGSVVSYAGIVVGGIPLPDSAGFQQDLLARLKPGSRVPDPIACTLTLEGRHPVLATAPIGASLIPETIKTVLTVIGQKQSLATTLAAPPLLADFAQEALPLGARKVDVPAGAYSAQFLSQVEHLGVPIAEVSAQQAEILRGTLATAVIDPKTGEASTVEVPGVMVFAGSN